MKLAGLDLNLLVALDALLEHRQVTAAAQAIGLSQPAMSRALGRLREALGDPVLVRQGTGMQPTPRALALQEEVRAALDAAERVFAPRPHFDPSTHTEPLVLGVDDLSGWRLGPQLGALQRAAPHMPIQLVRTPAALGEELGRGALFAAVGTWFPQEQRLQRQVLFEEQFAVALRADHPAAGKGLDLQTYAELPHVLVTNPGDGPGVVDRALALQGLRREVMLKTPDFLVAPRLVAHSDAVVTLPRSVLEGLAWPGIVVLEPPLALPSFEVSLYWHASVASEPKLAWLRSQLRA